MLAALTTAETACLASSWEVDAPLAGCRRAVGASLGPTHQHAQAMQMYDSKANGLLRLLGIEGCVRYFWRPHRSGIPSVWEGEPESATAVWLIHRLESTHNPGLERGGHQNWSGSLDLHIAMDFWTTPYDRNNNLVFDGNACVLLLMTQRCVEN